MKQFSNNVIFFRVFRVFRGSKMTFYTKLAFQNIIRHPIRSLITIVGIALGVAVILAVSMLNDTTRDAIERTIEALGSGNTDIWVEEFGENSSSIGSRLEGFSEDIITDISAHSAVLSIHPSLKLYVMGVSDQQQDPLEFYLCGIRFSDDRIVRDHILSTGNYPDNPQYILIGQELAGMFRVSIGSPLTIQTPKGPLMLTVAGLLTPDKGSGLWRNNRVVFADLAVVQEFFHYDNIVTSLNIVLKSNTNALGVAEEIKEFFPEQVKVMTDPLMVATKGDDSGQLRIMLLLYSFVSIVIAMFIIYNTLSSTVEESRKEIGMLRLVGMTSQQMIRFFLRQALMYAIIGSCMGIAFGTMLGWGMITLLRRVFTYQAFSLIFPSPGSFLTAIGIGIIVTMIVALFPAIKTANIPPLVVFRERETEQETTHRLTGRTLTGFALIVVPLLLGMLPVSGTLSAIIHLTIPIVLFIGLIMTLGYLLPFILKMLSWCFAKIFGVPGMLAAKSLQLRLKRTVVTMSAIMVTATISIGMLGSVVI